MRTNTTFNPVDASDLGADLDAGLRRPLDPVADQSGRGLAVVEPVDLAEDGRFVHARSAPFEGRDYTFRLNDRNLRHNR